MMPLLVALQLGPLRFQLRLGTAPAADVEEHDLATDHELAEPFPIGFRGPCDDEDD